MADPSGKELVNLTQSLIAAQGAVLIGLAAQGPESQAAAALENFVASFLAETKRKDGGDCIRIPPTVNYVGHA